MNYLTTIRDQLNYYGSFASKGQHGGGQDDTDSEPEDYHTSYVSEGLNQSDNLMSSTRTELLKNKSDYYDAAITQAPNPLDQNTLLTTVIEEDLKQIAEMLKTSMNNNFNSTNDHFKSCIITICKNNKDKIKLPEEPEKFLETYTNILNKMGLKCFRNCRIALNHFNTQTQNRNIKDCENMINNIFITYVFSQYNRSQQDE